MRPSVWCGARETPSIPRPQVLREVGNVLADNRFLTLTGPAGIGKSAIAHGLREPLSSAYEGVVFVDLAEVSNPDFLTHEIAAALVPDDDFTPQITRGRDAERVIRALSSRRSLLILDNCDGLGPPIAAVARRLGSLIPSLTILSTSRSRLGFVGELTWQVPGLSYPEEGERPHCASHFFEFDAVALFCQRASARLSSVEAPHSAELGAIAAICRKLRGNPLAIVVAAADVSVESYVDLLSRLEKEVLCPRLGEDTSVHRSSDVTGRLVRWAYDLLPEPEATLLARLSVFAGGFSLRAVEEICAGGAVVRSEIGTLVNSLGAASLVHSCSADRYILPRLIRDLGSRQLVENDEDHAIHQRHLEWYRDAAEAAERRVITGEDQIWWRRFLSDESANLRSAFEFARGEAYEDGLRLGSALWAYALIRSYADEWTERLQSLSAAVALPTSFGKAKALAVLGYLCGDITRRRQREAPELLRESLSICRQLPANPRLAWPAAWALCGLAHYEADSQSALEMLDEALQISKSSGDQLAEMRVLTDVAERRLQAESFGDARIAGERALACSRSLQCYGDMTKALSVLGDIYLFDGDASRSQETWEECLNLSRVNGYWPMSKLALQRLTDLADQRGDTGSLGRYADQMAVLSRCGHVEPWRGNYMRGYAHLRQGNLAISERLLQRALSAATDESATYVLDRLAEVALARGDHRAASELLRKSVNVLERYSPNGSHLGIGMLRVARIAEYENNADEAERLFRKVLFADLGIDRRGFPDALHAMGSIWLNRGLVEGAVSFFAAAHSARSGHPPALWQVTSQCGARDADIDRARQILSGDRFAAAWTRGSEASVTMIRSQLRDRGTRTDQRHNGESGILGNQW